MTFETKKTLKIETTEDWDVFLERRLAADLDAFLESVDDETFAFDAEELPRSDRRFDGNRRFFKRLSVVAASLAALCVVVAALSDYATSLKNKTNKTSKIARIVSESVDDEKSLVAWGVENWDAFDEAKFVGVSVERWETADFLTNWNKKEPTDRKFGADAAEKNAIEEEENAEVAENFWFDALPFVDKNAFATWKYEPALFLITCLL
ncbi:MAG: hypothetical protein IKU86_02355 [Thermoguttaceae bacterium]|nr:hypothetical protein [Thermoguttaceae bacterium]